GRESVAIDPTAATGQMVGVMNSSREDEIVTAMEVLRGGGMISKVVEKLTPQVVLGEVAPSKSENGEDKAGDAAPGDAETVEQKSEGVMRFARDIFGQFSRTLSQIDPLSDFERATILVAKSLKIDAERKSEVIVIEYEADSPTLAQAIVDAFITTYKEENARLHSTEGSQSFFDKQQERLANELQLTNSALREAKNRMGLASIQGHRESLEARAREIAQSISETERSLIETQARIKKLKTELASMPERISSSEVDKPNVATEQKSTQLYALQLQEMEFKTKYAPEHPKMVAIRSQLEQAEKQYRQQSTNRPETTNDINPVHRDLTIDYIKSETSENGLTKKLEILRDQDKDILNQIREINAFEIEITDLERKATLSEKKYIAYSESLEQARMNRELEKVKISSVSVAQEATLQERPIKPSKQLVALFGIMTLFFGSLGIALAAAKLDDRITTTQSVKNKVGVPLLATIPTSRYLARTNLSR
ncbi:MAG: GumC family protein, partial [Pirellula sp.]